MKINAPHTNDATGRLPLLAQRFGTPGHFSDLLSTRDAATDRAAKPDHDQARQAAEDLVGITLIRPLLDQARQDPFRSDLFHGGFAEDAFGARMDAIIAQRITKGTRLPIVDAVYNQIVNAANRVNTHG